MYKSLIKRRIKIRKNVNYIRHISKIIKIQCCIRQYIARKRRKEKEEEEEKLLPTSSKKIIKNICLEKR